MSFVVPPKSDFRAVDAHSVAFSVLRSLPVALLVVRGDGTTLMANLGACKTLERSRDELEGASIDSYLAPLRTVLRRAQSHNGGNKLQVTLPSRSSAVIGLSVADVDELRESFGADIYAIVLKDITATERLREERDRLLQVATVSGLMPAILHELKNPLAGIAAATELLAEDTSEEATRESARAIMGEVQRMKLNLDGVGSVGRKLKSPWPMVIDGPMREAFIILDAQARQKGLLIRGEIASMPSVGLDASVVCAMVYNLITNSIQACAAGDEIRLKASYIEDERAVEIIVEDSGSGMTEAVLSRCRELFYTTKRNGSGIGLALCDRAVREVGGAMVIESSPGRGTRVAIRLPAFGSSLRVVGR